MVGLSPRARSLLCALALLGPLGVFGCGRRGSPTPPELRLPQPSRNPALSAPAGRLTLSWSPPREDVGGRPITSVAGYRVDRAEWPPGEGACEACPERFEPVAELDSLERRSRGLPETSWQDSRTAPGWVYRYRVRALDRRGRAGEPSLPVTITWLPLPAPRAELVPGDRELRVRSEATTLPQGLRFLGLRVYDDRGRRIDRGDGDAVIPDLANGVPVDLEVRQAAQTPEGWVVEGPGAKLRATPEDTVPPLPPGDLVALREPGGIRLRWLPAGAEPYASILVFRARGGEGLEEAARLPGDTLEFWDDTVVPGEVYRYSAAALDRAGNRSLPSPEVRVRAR